jgi:hypothetical protein
MTVRAQTCQCGSSSIQRCQTLHSTEYILTNNSKPGKTFINSCLSGTVSTKKLRYAPGVIVAFAGLPTPIRLTHEKSKTDDQKRRDATRWRFFFWPLSPKYQAPLLGSIEGRIDRCRFCVVWSCPSVVQVHGGCKGGDAAGRIPALQQYVCTMKILVSFGGTLAVSFRSFCPFFVEIDWDASAKHISLPSQYETYRRGQRCGQYIALFAERFYAHNVSGQDTVREWSPIARIESIFCESAQAFAGGKYVRSKLFFYCEFVCSRRQVMAAVCLNRRSPVSLLFLSVFVSTPYLVQPHATKSDAYHANSSL